MDENMTAAQHIEALADERRHLTDQQILAELAALPVLPDEDDPAWDDDRTYLNHAYLFVAFTDLAAERHLRPAMLLLLERACYGDPGEMMRGLRHTLEGIAAPDWDLLTDVCLQAARLPQRGARLWAINELAILREPRTLDTLIAALEDPATLVRDEAVGALESLGASAAACRSAALGALRRLVMSEADPGVARSSRAALAKLEGMAEP